MRMLPFGLTEATWLPLLYISRAEEPMRQKDLANTLVLHNSSVVRLIDALEAGGLVKRRDGIQDRRVKTIHLLPAAHNLIERVESESRSVRDELLEGLTEQELQTVVTVLSHISARLTTIETSSNDVK